MQDVAIAGDGSWCVIHDKKAVFSTGVSDEVQKEINRFFRRQENRRRKRSIEIRTFKEKMRKEAEERKRKLEEEEAQRKRRKFEIEEAARKRIDLIGSLEVGTRVTVFGHSRNMGDAKVTAQYTSDD